MKMKGTEGWKGKETFPKPVTCSTNIYLLKDLSPLPFNHLPPFPLGGLEITTELQEGKTHENRPDSNNNTTLTWTHVW